MVWGFRPGQPAEEQLNNIEKELGLDNLKDCEIINVGGTDYLYLYRNNKTFRVALTEVV